MKANADLFRQGERVLQREDSGAQERVHVYVSGRVQGVFFRGSAREEANRLGVSGWASNLPDGRVEAVFEGDAASVREMIRWCETGPSHAAVESVEAESEEPQGLDGFEAR